MLWRAGFATPQLVGVATPKHLALSLSALPNVDLAAMHENIATLRRMVLLGSMELDGKRSTSSSLRSLTDDDLTKLGILETDPFDDLTGQQMKRQLLFTTGVWDQIGLQ